MLTNLLPPAVLVSVLLLAVGAMAGQDEPSSPGPRRSSWTQEP